MPKCRCPRLFLAAVGLALASTVLVACTTPSVPIPPPEPERMSFQVDVQGGSAQFAYEPAASYANAVVYVFNRDQGQGVITTAADDGSVAATPPFPAAEGDNVVVSFELEQQIASTCVILRDGQSSSAFECDL